MEWQRVKSFWAKQSVLLAFAALLIIASLLNDHFFTSNNLLNIFKQVSIIGIIALGQCVVILSGGFDLSVGAVLALVGVVGLTIMNNTDSVLIGAAAMVLAGLLVGLLNGITITKGKIAPFIVTLGMMSIARSLVLYYADGGSVSGAVSGFTEIANGKLLGIPYPIYIFVVCTAAISILMNKTAFGRHIYAIGSNEKAALLSAIPVNRVKTYAYMLCGMLVGLAALLESSKLNSISSSSSGHSYELDAIAAVVIGGTRLSGGKGTIFGTFIGVLILGVLNNIINLMNVSPYLQGMVKGLIIILAVLLQKKE